MPLHPLAFAGHSAAAITVLTSLTADGGAAANNAPLLDLAADGGAADTVTPGLLRLRASISIRWSSGSRQALRSFMGMSAAHWRCMQAGDARAWHIRSGRGCRGAGHCCRQGAPPSGHGAELLVGRHSVYAICQCRLHLFAP